MDVTLVASQTEVLNPDEADASDAAPVLRLRLQKPRKERKVGWQEGTVDNENMGKKKSKCCCIYKKPVAFGESSSEDDEDCEHCFGHPEKRKKNRQNRNHSTDDCGHHGNSCAHSDGEAEAPADETKPLPPENKRPLADGE